MNCRKSNWSKLKTYINDNYKIGDVISRQTLVRNLGKRPSYAVDSYRLQLTIIGIVEVVKPGGYKLICKIPDDMNTINLIDLVSDIRKYPWKK